MALCPPRGIQAIFLTALTAPCPTDSEALRVGLPSTDFLDVGPHLIYPSRGDERWFLAWGHTDHGLLFHTAFPSPAITVAHFQVNFHTQLSPRKLGLNICAITSPLYSRIPRQNTQLKGTDCILSTSIHLRTKRLFNRVCFDMCIVMLTIGISS